MDLYQMTAAQRVKNNQLLFDAEKFERSQLRAQRQRAKLLAFRKRVSVLRDTFAERLQLATVLAFAKRA